MRLLEFARSTILFRIDLDVLPPRTLSHKPPFAMNNARAGIEAEAVSDAAHLAADKATAAVDAATNPGNPAGAKA